MFISVKKPEPVPEPEVPKDPATAVIVPNKETIIELNADNKPLGIIVVKGDSSQIQAQTKLHCNGEYYFYKLTLIIIGWCFNNCNS